MEASLHMLCEKAHHCRVAPVPVHHPTSQKLSAQLHSQHFPLHLHQHHVLDDLSIFPAEGERQRLVILPIHAILHLVCDPPPQDSRRD